MDSRIYSPITRQQLESFLTKAKSTGFDLQQSTPNSGIVSGHNTQVSFLYDEGSQKVTLTLDKHVPLAANATWTQIEHHLPPSVSRV